MVGLPTVFIRLTGCPLRCQYCDTAYAFSGGSRWHIDAILAEVARTNTRYVTVTGGEPLAQPSVHTLLKVLCDQGYVVSLETSGSLPVREVDSRVIKIVDFKTPGSGECDRNDFSNVDFLDEKDEVKFVICNRADYEWAKDCIQTYALTERVAVLFSPSATELAPKELADWIVADQLSVRFQMQLHKVLWGDKKGV